jgi:fido (protein-threonine AMPylation protein)
MDRHPIFLTPAQVLALHRRTIERHGGDPGLRDAGLLDSAIAQPMAMYDGQFLHEGLAEMAAAYLFHLAMNHPFVDGNKRIAALAYRLFSPIRRWFFSNNTFPFDTISVKNQSPSSRRQRMFFGGIFVAMNIGDQVGLKRTLHSVMPSSSGRIAVANRKWWPSGRNHGKP